MAVEAAFTQRRIQLGSAPRILQTAAPICYHLHHVCRSQVPRASLSETTMSPSIQDNCLQLVSLLQTDVQRMCAGMLDECVALLLYSSWLCEI